MELCPECGRSVEASTAYCPQCGVRVRPDASPERNEPQGAGPKPEAKTREAAPGPAHMAAFRERLADTRLNEDIGWKAVVLAVVLVAVLALFRAQTEASQVTTVFSGYDVLHAMLRNITLTVFIMALILIVLGVTVALSSRYQRSRLLRQLERLSTDQGQQAPGP